MPDDEPPDWLDNVVSAQHSLGVDGNDLNGAAYSTDSYHGRDEVIFPGSYDQLLRGVRGNFDVRFGHILKRVNMSHDGLLLRDTKERKAIFDAIVLVVPLGMFKQGSISFSPPLPESKTEVIKRLGMGLLDKVYLCFDGKQMLLALRPHSSN